MNSALPASLIDYRDALEGRRDAKGLWRELRASNQYGVTRGSLSVIG